MIHTHAQDFQLDIDLKDQCEDLLLEMISNPCLLAAEHKAAVSVLKILTSRNEAVDDDEDDDESGVKVKDKQRDDGAGETNKDGDDSGEEGKSSSATCSISVSASDRYLTKLLTQPLVSDPA